MDEEALIHRDITIREFLVGKRAAKKMVEFLRLRQE